MNKTFQKRITENDLIKKFSKLEIYPKDKIIINSSMSKIGILENGATKLINALKNMLLLKDWL